jgi:oxygen-independent coproporphyrinogen-3 oxidase
MYGIPLQNTASLSETLDKIISLSPEHISAYGLIIEEGTPFYKERDVLPVPSDDEECDMYYLIADRLAKAGYSHYEISNYARSDRESRHNLKYWRDEEYIGVGAAAYSYFEGRRFGNTRSLTDYLAGTTVVDSESIDRDGNMYEYAMMHLRLKEGIPFDEYESIFGVSFLNGREALIKEYEALGLLKVGDNRLSLTESGFYVSNTLLANLL